jgi:maleylpyruvate isomerase
MDPRLPDSDTVSRVETSIDREVAATITSCRASHAALVTWLRGLRPVDPATPSSLPDWTVGHVLTHLARNADGHLSMLAGRPQYPHGSAGRDADIERGAGRSWDELVDDVAVTATALDQQWAVTSEWSGSAMLLSGTRPRHLLPLLRQREVEVHRADLGLGYGFDDMPTDYVRRDLRLMGMVVRARTPMGLTPLPDAVLALPPATRLAWMLGRAGIDGPAPAGLF